MGAAADKALTFAASAPTLAAHDPEDVSPSGSAPGQPPVKRLHRPRTARGAAHAELADPVAPTASATISAPPPPAVTGPDAPPPGPPAPARELRARIDVDVTGSLPAGEVKRAIERRRSAITRCAPEAPGALVATFTVGETRRARDVRAIGAPARTNACVMAVLSDVRTEAAPDIGDVTVTVRIAFVVKT